MPSPQAKTAGMPGPGKVLGSHLGVGSQVGLYELTADVRVNVNHVSPKHSVLLWASAAGVWRRLCVMDCCVRPSVDCCVRPQCRLLVGYVCMCM